MARGACVDVLNVGQGLLRCLRTRASATTFAFKDRAKEIHYVEAHVLCAPLFKRPTQCHANAKRQAKSKHSPFKGVRRANWFLGEFRSIPQLSKSWHNGSRVVWAVPECVTRTVHLNRHARAHFASRTQCSSHLTPTFRAGAMHWHVDTLSQSKLGLAGVATPPQHPSSQNTTRTRSHTSNRPPTQIREIPPRRRSGPCALEGHSPVVNVVATASMAPSLHQRCRARCSRGRAPLRRAGRFLPVVEDVLTSRTSAHRLRYRLLAHDPTPCSVTTDPRNYISGMSAT